jgi:ATP-dependent RNA helicase RhlE
MRFEDLRLSEPLLRAVRAAGYRTPTPIQAQAIPHVLAGGILNKPALVQVARVSSAASTVAHWVYHVEQPQKLALPTRLLVRKPRDRSLVFTRTKHGADKLTRHLLKAGLRAAALHGNKSQGARTRALAEFRSARTPVLVATDIAARGLDVQDVAQVFNYDLTPDPETYVHGVGRTGRAGAEGTAVSLCTSQERANLRGIERLLGNTLRAATTPSEAIEGVRISGTPVTRLRAKRSASEMR